MQYLSIVTCLWAFSFSLIGVYLAGCVDAWFSAFARIALAALVFLPLMRLKGLGLKLMGQLMAIGGVQLGLMYCFYYQSFLYLSVPEVVLFTVFTPLYITLTYDIIYRRFSPWYFVSAACAVLGAAIIKYATVNPNFMLGFLIVQGANLSFAIGQTSYKVLMEKAAIERPQAQIFGLFYLGALIVTLPAFLLFGDSSKLPTTSTQWGVIFYLGTIASGLGYFLWNKGATLVNAGTLAVMNNALVPAGIMVNLLIWNKEANWLPLVIGSLIIFASLLFNHAKIQIKLLNFYRKFSARRYHIN